MKNYSIYKLTLCKDEPEEETVYACLSDDLAQTIRDKLAKPNKVVNREVQFKAVGGKKYDIGVVDAIEHFSKKQITANQISTFLRKDNVLEIYVKGAIVAEITDGREDSEFVYDILEGMGYEIVENEKTIRFIDSCYNEKFRINDRDIIRITEQSGNTFEHICEYIDECHTKIGSQIFHICEYAELTERNGWTVEPVKW